MQDKRAFYSQREVSDSYDELRFGGASGARVNQREIELVLGMLPSEGQVLDLACGTGRLTRALRARAQRVVALDFSPAMAARAAVSGAITVVGDAFGTPFPAARFEAVVSLRFAFHHPQLEPLLAEMRRVALPGGTLVFDTYSWSPRSIWALGARTWGGRVHVHSRRVVAETCARLGLRIHRAEARFLFSPYLYRLAPLPVERVLEGLEQRVPRAWLCRVFWKAVVEPTHAASPQL